MPPVTHHDSANAAVSKASAPRHMTNRNRSRLSRWRRAEPCPFVGGAVLVCRVERRGSGAGMSVQRPQKVGHQRAKGVARLRQRGEQEHQEQHDGHAEHTREDPGAALTRIVG